MKQHTYTVGIEWVGNNGDGTRTYRSYRRDYILTAPGKANIDGSSDPDFLGDAHRYNPEELLVASLSSCHMLWYLHLCAASGITVQSYSDSPVGTMEETEEGSGAFTRVLLRPIVTVSPGGDIAQATALHEEAHRYCFIARSVNFPVDCESKIIESDKNVST